MELGDLDRIWNLVDVYLDRAVGGPQYKRDRVGLNGTGIDGVAGLGCKMIGARWLDQGRPVCFSRAFTCELGRTRI